MASRAASAAAAVAAVAVAVAAKKVKQALKARPVRHQPTTMSHPTSGPTVLHGMVMWKPLKPFWGAMQQALAKSPPVAVVAGVAATAVADAVNAKAMAHRPEPMARHRLALRLMLRMMKMWFRFSVNARLHPLPLRRYRLR
jgi:hypothetical protein